MMITTQKVLEALSHVNDPDLQKDLVTLQMIKDLEVTTEKISFTVELTTPACPMKEQIQRACENAIRIMVSPTIDLTINMSAKVSSANNGKASLKGVKNIIAVASGKGGVGKSTIACNLALGLSQQGATVGLLDADIYGPSVPIMLQKEKTIPELVVMDNKNIMLPVEAYGIKAMSIGFLVKPEDAVAWRGPMASSALRQFFTDVDWGELDYLIIDLPPGTGDIHLSLISLAQVTGAVIVTTPQTIALADAQKAISMFTMQNVKIPILGVVENMSWFTPKAHLDEQYFLFGKDGGKHLAEENNVNLLGQIPIIQDIREGGDYGEPAVLQTHNPIRQVLLDLASKVAQQIAIQNANNN